MKDDATQEKGKEQARTRIEQLIQEYRSFAATLKEDDVKEERVKIGYIAPLIEALGWNLRTDEVLPEQRTLLGQADFGLRAYGPTPQIYVECKSFRESLDNHRIERGRQVTYPEKAIQYAWSMKADWAILTNFKKLRLYYSRVKKPSEGLVFELSFEEFASKFDELWLLSKDSVASGAIETHRKMATRKPVDEQFLRDLVECRQELVDSIRENNPTLTVDDINEGAQRILDRIVFVRSCEDRNIVHAEMLWEQYVHWEKITIDKTARTFMMDLKNIFRDIEGKHDGKLFELHPCEDMIIKNAVFQDILERLYGDSSRGYRFDAIPVNVLGQAYELYIGSVIKEKAGAARSLEIVQDYKKRQQQGIYYTPIFVTHFIVRRTLGHMLEKTQTGDDLLRLKVVDQAAGSGSFLIEAFDQLKERYLAFKMEHEKTAERAPLEVRLIQPEWVDPQNAILKNNIYGVDLDPQAVEITTLNLELKAVRTKEKIPYLGEHIQLGNSIVHHTASELLEKFTEDEIQGLLGKTWRTQWENQRPFKYQERFEQVMSNGGFNVVIGNPPYNNMRDPELRVEQAYCEKFHQEVFRGNSDVLFYFIESGLSILKPGGLLGLIVARYFMQSDQGDRIRKYILEHSKIRYIVDTRNTQVFGKVNVLTCIIVLERDDSPTETKSKHRIKVVNVKNTFKGTLEQLFEHIEQHIEAGEISDDWIDVFEKEQGSLSEDPWTLEPPHVERLLEKIEQQDCWPLESPDTCQVGVGYDTELNEAKLDGEIEREEATKHPVFILRRREAEQLRLEKDLLVKMTKEFEIQRYALLDNDYVLLNTNRETHIERYPNVKKHLARFRNQLEKRNAMPRCAWFGVGLPKNRELFEANPTKILVPKYATGNKFGYDDGEGRYCTSDAYIVVKNRESKVDLRYILAVLNSRMMEFYHKKRSKLKREGYYEYFAERLRRLPIRKIDLRNEKDKATHDRLVELVIGLVDAKKRLIEIERSFAECVALYPVSEKSDLSRLKSYYDSEGVRPTVLEDANSKRGKVSSPIVSKEKNRITLFIDYLSEDEEGELVNTTPVVDLNFENGELCDFTYYSLRMFVAAMKSPKLGEGNILDVIQKRIKIPYFGQGTARRRENARIIHKIMKQFRARTKGLLGRNATIEQMEEEIQLLDNSIETEVRKLYEITSDEAQIIKNELLSGPQSRIHNL
jgi:type I restriction-modification system DNA methylase subunit